MTATSIYTSFPPIVDESPILIPLGRLALMDTSVPVCEMIDGEVMKGVGGLDSGVTHLDCAGYTLVPATPTRDRSRRATMPAPTKPRPYDVLSPPSQSLHRYCVLSLGSISSLGFLLCYVLVDADGSSSRTFTPPLKHQH
jgi:hypothetical protein